MVQPPLGNPTGRNSKGLPLFPRPVLGLSSEPTLQTYEGWLQICHSSDYRRHSATLSFPELVLRQVLKNVYRVYTCITYSNHESNHDLYRFFLMQPITKIA